MLDLSLIRPKAIARIRNGLILEVECCEFNPHDIDYDLRANKYPVTIVWTNGERDRFTLSGCYDIHKNNHPYDIIDFVNIPEDMDVMHVLRYGIHYYPSGEKQND